MICTELWLKNNYGEGEFWTGGYLCPGTGPWTDGSAGRDLYAGWGSGDGEDGIDPGTGSRAWNYRACKQSYIHDRTGI